jgi:LacI family transcriptional regulator
MRPEDLRSLLEGKLPVVFINSTHRGHVGSVAMEDERGMRLATEHLISLGHTRIGFINGLTDADTAIRRRRGFTAGMTAAGLTVLDGYLTELGYEPRQGREALRTLAAQPTPPTAIVVANVNAALGALLEARTLGLRVPEDLSIIAMHDAWTAENAWPPLTTVRMPLYELGKEAVGAIFDRITQAIDRDVVITDPAPEIVLRESTAAPKRI